MKNTNIYKRYRFPSEIIQYTVWLYYRFTLSHRDIEDLLAERGIDVTYEAIRLWCNRFGPKFATRLKKSIGDMVIHFLSMKFSSRLMVSNTTSGGRLTRMVRLLMCISKNDVTVQQQSVSLKDY